VSKNAPAAGFGRQRRGDVLGKITALRAFRRQFDHHLGTGRNAKTAHPRRVQGERPSAAGRRNRHPYPAFVDRAVDVMHRFGAPSLVRVKRDRDNGVATRIFSDPDAEPSSAHGHIVS
jgi:hypothetical protein